MPSRGCACAVQGGWKQLMLLCGHSLPPSPRAGCFRRRPPLLLLFSTASFPTCYPPRHLHSHAARHTHRRPAHRQTGCVDGHTAHSNKADTRRLGIAQAGSRRLTRKSIPTGHLGVLIRTHNRNPSTQSRLQRSPQRRTVSPLPLKSSRSKRERVIPMWWLRPTPILPSKMWARCGNRWRR